MSLSVWMSFHIVQTFHSIKLCAVHFASLNEIAFSPENKKKTKEKEIQFQFYNYVHPFVFILFPVYTAGILVAVSKPIQLHKYLFHE